VCCQGINKLTYRISSKASTLDNSWEVAGLNSTLLEENDKIVLKPSNIGIAGEYAFYIFAENLVGSNVFS